MFFRLSFVNSGSKSDERNDFDSGNDKKVYNLTDILSSPSGFHKYEWQQKHHYESKSSSTDTKTKEKRYYIYSHKTDASAEEINRDDKSRKIRSSPLSDRKQISKNISMVLENLLMSYENSQLPTHDEGLTSFFFLEISGYSSDIDL